MKENLLDPDIMELANKFLTGARKRDRRSVHKVLEGAVIALRGIIEHKLLPDQERELYLEFVLEALEKITHKTDPELPNIAFCWTASSGPQKIAKYETFAIFMMVGRESDIQKRSGSTKPIDQAIKKVANRLKGPAPETVREQWELLGSSKAWQRLKRDFDLKDKF